MANLFSSKEAVAIKPCGVKTSSGKGDTMKALVYHGAGNKFWEQTAKPVLQEPTDAVVRIFKTTICGTDLHIMNGAVKEG